MSIACQRAREAHLPPPGDDAALRLLAADLARPEPVAGGEEPTVVWTTLRTVSTGKWFRAETQTLDGAWLVESSSTWSYTIYGMIDFLK